MYIRIVYRKSFCKSRKKGCKKKLEKSIQLQSRLASQCHTHTHRVFCAPKTRYIDCCFNVLQTLSCWMWLLGHGPHDLVMRASSIKDREEICQDHICICIGIFIKTTLRLALDVFYCTLSPAMMLPLCIYYRLIRSSLKGSRNHCSSFFFFICWIFYHPRGEIRVYIGCSELE